MFSNRPIERRRFLSLVGGVGAAMAMGNAQAQTEPTASSGASVEGWPTQFDPMRIEPRWNPREMPKPGDVIHEYDIELVIARHEILPRIEYHAYAYNGTVPGPEIRVKEGEWVKVNFTNKTHDFHTIHWHGMQLANEMDGVPMETQFPVAYGQTFQYLFRAQPAGTHFYHCHNMTPLHIQAGMYGALIVESDDDPVHKLFPYTRDYTLVLSEIDLNMVREQMNEMLQMGRVMDAMNGSPQLMREMSGKMMGWFVNKEAFLKAIADGWIPPYDPSLAGSIEPPKPNFFMINGVSYPMTEPLRIRRGEFIRVRLINAGFMPHFMHLHGHDFWEVCRDGAPLSSPIQLNTIPVFPGGTCDIIIHGNNPGSWHFHDHSDLASTNNGVAPGGMMTMLMYEDMAEAGVHVPDYVAVNS